MELIPYEEDGKDIFQIDATEEEDVVSLKGTNGIMLAYAFNMYGHSELQFSIGISRTTVILRFHGVREGKEITLRFQTPCPS